MPDIDNRDRKEAALAALIRRAMGKTRDRILAALGTPPDVENVPDALWDELTADVEDDLRNAIAIALLRGVRGMNEEYGEQLGFRVAPKDAAVQAQKFATTRARQTAQSLVSTFRDRLATAAGVANERIDRRIAEARRDEVIIEDEDFDDIFEELEDAADETIQKQAESSAATETTNANTAGERVYEKAAGKEEKLIVAYWRTEEDPRVCPVCDMLDGTTEDKWPPAFQNGPPAHVSCRCWLTWN